MKINEYIVRHQLLVRVIVVAAVTGILLIFAVIPLGTAISKNTAKIASRDKERLSLVDKVTLLSELDDQVLQDRLKILDAALPPRKDVVAYLASMDGLSRELGLSFGGISIAPGEVKDKPDSNSKKQITGLQTLDTTIKVKGDQNAIYSFLRSVEQTLPLMQIKDVKISGVGVGQYSLSLSLGMLWAPPLPSDVKGAVALFNDKEEEYFKTLSTYRSYKADLGDTTANSPSGKTDLFSQ